MNDLLTRDPGFPALCRGTPDHFAPGIYFDVPRETYDRIPCLSATVIKKWLQHQETPSVFEYWLEHRWEEEPTEALIIGSALDCMAMEPDMFALRYATVPPNAPRRPSKAQRNAKNPSTESAGAIAFWDKFAQETAGKTILTQPQLECVLGMNKALGAKRGLYGVFENCRKAVLVGEIDGWPCKAEVDLWSPRSSHIPDIKTAEDVSPDGFFRAIDRYSYATQGTWYLKLAENLGGFKTAFDFIAVGKEPPFPVRMHVIDIETEEGGLVYASELVRIKEGLRSLVRALTEMDFEDDNDWHPVKFPEWYLARARQRLVS